MSDGWRINMIGCTDTIIEELTWEHSTRKSVGLSYALAMKSEAQGADTPDWKTINAAIRERWGLRGLERVKQRAWRLCEGKENP